jgi:uncharacterized protein (TIGR01244 family)
MTRPPRDTSPNDRSASPPARQKRWWLLPSLLLAVPLLCLVGWWIHWLMTGRQYIVEPGEFYRSAQMPPEDLVDFCRRHDIRTVVNLRAYEPGDPTGIRERAALEAAGIRYVPLPSRQVPTPDLVQRFLDLLDQPGSRPILVHCEHGVGRTGVFTAIYRMEVQGWSNEDALREARVMAGFDSFEEGSGKREFLLNYVPRSRRPHRTTPPAGSTLPSVATRPAESSSPASH